MIKIEQLSVAFWDAKVVKDVTIEIADGEIVGVVGESGSGKSVTALTLMGLVSEEATITGGRILFDDVVLADGETGKNAALYRKYLGDEMTMIFQEPMTSLNPTQRVGMQVEEVLKLHTKLTKEQRTKKVLETFQAVGFSDAKKVFYSYPHQLSGGMRQRVMIAMAIILKPRLLVADEPTTALDVTIQNQIIALLKEINEKQKNAMLFITHDLNLAKRLCDRIVVMKDGMVIEQGESAQIFAQPKENYTKQLIYAVPTRIQKKVPRKATEEVLRVSHLDVFYPEKNHSIFAGKKKHQVVSDANFTLYKGEVLGLVGESGCGKTSLSKAILGINRDIKGEIYHAGTYPQMIFQDPYSSLNPTKSIGWLLEEPLRVVEKSKEARKMAAMEMLKKVGLEERYYDRLPSQLSGGQRQRISIGQALITRPEFVIADEPVSALDVTIQAQIMELMQQFQEELHLSYLFISHDIHVVYRMCDRVMVMKDGKIIETNTTQEIFDHPKEAYTKLLLANS